MKKGIPAWITLGLIALVAGLLLGFTNELTAPVIAQQTLIKDEEARRAVLPQAEAFEPLDVAEDAGLDSCYQGLVGEAAVGYVAQVTVKGYGGEIQVTVGMDTAGIITGISVGGSNFSETMGLGAKTRDAAFTDQFAGLDAPIALGTDVDAVTNATISSTAVVSGVNIACEYIQTLLP